MCYIYIKSTHILGFGLANIPRFHVQAMIIQCAYIPYHYDTHWLAYNSIATPLYSSPHPPLTKIKPLINIRNMAHNDELNVAQPS